MNKDIRNIKIRLLAKKNLVIFSCYFNACRDFFVSLIEKENNNNNNNNNKNYIIIQKIKHKFVEKFKSYEKNIFFHNIYNVKVFFIFTEH
ncbi:MAG: hypothetical protein LBV69_05945 [Bacteroidales bacterium]|jgi:hypothetical protein|nr:hypothetical protein [Bacteroidales bacterium]